MQIAKARVPAIALGAAILSSCASPSPPQLEAFVTRDRQVVISASTVPEGEVILRVENDDDAPQELVLIRLREGIEVSDLPVSDGRLPVGKRWDVHFTAAGYTVVAKLDRMSAYLQGPKRIRDVIHDYLPAGRYVLFSNLRDQLAAGRFAEFTVRERG